MTRRLLLALLAALAVAFLWMRAARTPEPAGAPPMEHIDDASRERLRETLREGEAP